jgi:hypothetical protein
MRARARSVLVYLCLRVVDSIFLTPFFFLAHSFLFFSIKKTTTQDDVVETLTVRAHLESLGMQRRRDLFYYLDSGGEHNEKYWGARFHVPMTDLYSPAPAATSPAGK